MIDDAGQEGARENLGVCWRCGEVLVRVSCEGGGYVDLEEAPDETGTWVVMFGRARPAKPEDTRPRFCEHEKRCKRRWE